MKAKTLSILKALSDETRLQIVIFLSQRKINSCSDLSEKFSNLTQPTMSHHFKILSEAEIIIVKKEGTSRIYTLNEKLLKESGINIAKIS